MTNICPCCESDNFMKINFNSIATEVSYRRKDNYDWNINYYFCLDCNNIFGEKNYR